MEYLQINSEEYTNNVIELMELKSILEIHMPTNTISLVLRNDKYKEDICLWKLEALNTNAILTYTVVNNNGTYKLTISADNTENKKITVLVGITPKYKETKPIEYILMRKKYIESEIDKYKKMQINNNNLISYSIHSLNIIKRDKNSPIPITECAIPNPIVDEIVKENTLITSKIVAYLMELSELSNTEKLLT